MEEESVRVIAPIPGKNAVGVEVPNKKKRMVRLSEVLNSPKFNTSKSPTTFALGVDLYNNVHVGDIKDLPHMLVAGATGAGKSVCINTLLISLLYKASPEDLRLILIDPKRVEMSDYAGLPHLMLDEIICDVDKAIRALNWAIVEMNRRILFLEQNKFRNIEDYNADCEKTGNEKMPRIVLVVDELADLMALGKKAVEDNINRIARLARAVGIHLIVATQRPSVDVVSGTIKNNLPSRIAFHVTAGPDSRTILDAGGAEKLLGNGDMLYMTAKTPMPIRMQGSFVSSEEGKAVVDFIKSNNDSVYDPTVKDQIFKEVSDTPEKEEGRSADKRKQKGQDPVFFDALRIGMEETISISYLQRKLGLGFQKAARIWDMMKDMGVLVPDEKDPKRSRVNLTQDEYEELLSANDEEE
jgi:S-DNA-T family DNA segregation ATPase FtsK/SpoIIIE